MNIALSGGPNLNRDVDGTSVTNIAADLSVGLQLANWTVVSGSPSDYKLQSVATPQGLQCRIRVRQVSPNVVINFMNIQETVTSPDHYLKFQSGFTYRLICNPYQFFVLLPLVNSVARTFVAGGNLAVPESFLQPYVKEAIWSQCNGGTASDTTVRATYRTSAGAESHAVNASWQSLNGNLISQQAFSSNRTGPQNQHLLGPFGYNGSTVGTGSTDNSGFRLHGGAGIKFTSRVMWSRAWTTTPGPPFVIGQIWDSFGSTAVQQTQMDLTDSFEGRTYYLITGNNDIGFGLPGLWVLVP